MKNQGGEMSQDLFEKLAIRIEKDVKKYRAAIQVQGMKIKPEGFIKKYSIQAIKFSVVIEYENGGRFFARLPEKSHIQAFGRTAKQVLDNFRTLCRERQISGGVTR